MTAIYCDGKFQMRMSHSAAYTMSQYLARHGWTVRDLSEIGFIALFSPKKNPSLTLNKPKEAENG